MRAEQPHRLARGGAHRRQAEPLDQRLDDALRRLARMDDAAVRPSVQAEADTSSAVERASCCAQSPPLSLSSISRSAVSASGTRSSASASTISARPSLVESA